MGIPLPPIFKMAATGSSSQSFLRHLEERVTKESSVRKEALRKRVRCRPTQQCILKALKLLCDLKEIHKSLPEGGSLEGDTKKKVEGIKMQLEAACSDLDKLAPPGMLPPKRRRKRIKHRALTCDADVRDVYETAEAAADKWLSTKREEEGKQKEMRALDKGAKKSALEVKSKIKDMESMQNFFQWLEQVRSVRGETYWREGTVLPGEGEDAFVSTVEQLREVLRERMEMYSLELRACESMLTKE